MKTVERSGVSQMISYSVKRSESPLRGANPRRSKNCSGMGTAVKHESH